MNEAAIEQARAEAARYGQQQVPEKWKKKEATTHVEQTPGKQRKPDTYIDGLPGYFEPPITVDTVLGEALLGLPGGPITAAPNGAVDGVAVVLTSLDHNPAMREEVWKFEVRVATADPRRNRRDVTDAALHQIAYIMDGRTSPVVSNPTVSRPSGYEAAQIP
jgi:hypothetical protein